MTEQEKHLMTITDRTAYTQGLRQLADLLDQHPDIQPPYLFDELTFFIHRDIGQVVALHNLMDSQVLTHESGNFPVKINGLLAGFKVTVYVDAATALQVPFAPTLPALVPALAVLMDDASVSSS